jgi:hypothetical protein
MGLIGKKIREVAEIFGWASDYRRSAPSNSNRVLDRNVAMGQISEAFRMHTCT